VEKKMNKAILNLALTSGLLVLGGLTAMAQNPPKSQSPSKSPSTQSPSAQSPSSSKSGGDAFSSLDSNKDGKLSQSEFGSYAESKGKKSSQDKQSEFKSWDSDGDGSISKAEFSAKSGR
jgi:hypothetical protein